MDNKYGKQSDNDDVQLSDLDDSEFLKCMNNNETNLFKCEPEIEQNGQRQGYNHGYDPG